MEQQVAGENYLPRESESYMCAKHLDYFREKLILWRKQIEQESQEAIARLREEKVREADVMDQGLAEVDLALNLKNRERCRNTLSRIDAAMQRIENGTYGYCEETGEEIGLRRLMASPLSTLSVEAQERLERMMKTQRYH